MASTAVCKPRINQVSGAIVSSAMRVHSLLGPGLLESAYDACLAHELRKRGYWVLSQVGLPLVYDGEKLDLGYRIDLLVDDLVIVEVKCVEAIHPVHEASAAVLPAVERKKCRAADQLPRGSIERWDQADG